MFAMLASRRANGCWFRYGFGMLIAFGAIGVLYLQFDPTPAGSEPGAANLTKFAPKISVPEFSQSASSAGSAKTGSAENERPQALEGRPALQRNLALLEQGLNKLKEVGNYTATLFRQERVNGELLQPEAMSLKLRHQPFSVYMKWLDGGHADEALYVDGGYEGKLVVNMGGWKSRLVPALKLDPEGSLALEHSRYPITELGLLELARKLIRDRRHDLDTKAGLRCRMMDNQTCNDRDCFYFDLEYETREFSAEYRRSVQYIDKEYSVPVCIRNYGWPDPLAEAETEPGSLDAATLVEFYSYTDIEMNSKLADVDFDHTNSDYRFQR